jgi:hypothetical protein
MRPYELAFSRQEWQRACTAQGLLVAPLVSEVPCITSPATVRCIPCTICRRVGLELGCGKRYKAVEMLSPLHFPPCRAVRVLVYSCPRRWTMDFEAPFALAVCTDQDLQSLCEFLWQWRVCNACEAGNRTSTHNASCGWLLYASRLETFIGPSLPCISQSCYQAALQRSTTMATFTSSSRHSSNM